MKAIYWRFERKMQDQHWWWNMTTPSFANLSYLRPMEYKGPSQQLLFMKWSRKYSGSDFIYGWEFRRFSRQLFCNPGHSWLGKRLNSQPYLSDLVWGGKPYIPGIPNHDILQLWPTGVLHHGSGINEWTKQYYTHFINLLTYAENPSWTNQDFLALISSGWQPVWVRFFVGSQYEE
jgi:hypothetical protein